MTEQEKIQAVVDAIPYWPEQTTVSNVMKQTGLSCGEVRSIVNGYADVYLIGEEDGKITRLKDDLSNVEEKEIVYEDCRQKKVH